MLVDSHCHLDFPDFAGDFDEMLARAAHAGVIVMVSICTRMRSEPEVRALAEAHAPIFYAAGVHPLNAHEEPLVDIGQLLRIARHPKMIGIGESGLDYHYAKDGKAIQRRSFQTHIEAAQRSGLPLIVHTRDADDDTKAMLREGMAEAPFTCVMHCFSSGRGLAEAALEMGFYLSMSGIATFKNAQDIRDIFRAAPLDRVLVETDAPYLSPPPHRGKRNEPAHVALTAQVGAEVFGVTPETFARATTDNFHRLFAKAANPSGAAGEIEVAG